MRRNLKVRGKSVALSAALGAIVLSSACGGETEQGSSCTVAELAGGQVQVSCPDGTRATISGPSSDATSCSFEESEGAVRIRCDDGTDVVIRDGVDGTSGASCSVEEGAHGSATIVCEDGSSAPIGTPAPGVAPGELSLELLAGVTSVGTTDGVGTETRMDGALDGVYDPHGEFLYFVDTFNMTIRRFGLRTQQVVTLAGLAGQKGASDGVGDQATFDGPRGIAIHPDGDRLFIADGFNCTIRQLHVVSREVTTLTGQPGECAAVDGTFEEARFRLTIGMVVESSGRYLYVADRGNNVIRRIDLEDNVVETIAGHLPVENGNEFRGHADGVGTDARFAGPGGIDLSEDESTLYINDTFNNVIRSLVVAVDEDAGGGPALFEVETIAGAPGVPGNIDGSAEEARFQVSQGLARAEDGLFVAGFHNSIRRIDLNTHEVTTVAGQNGVGGSSDGPYFDARFGVSFGILAHPDGRRVYYMDRGNNSIRLYDRRTRQVSTVMGAPEPTGWRDGEAGVSRLNGPRGVVSNEAGTRFYVADGSNQVIRVYDAETGGLSTLAGLPGRAGFRDGVADEARFAYPEGLWLNSEETQLYVADSGNDAIRRIDLGSAQVSTVAGMPLADEETSADGPLEEARFDAPFAIVGDESAEGLVLYVSDYASHLIRRVELGSGQVTTLAGGGESDEENPAAIDGVGAQAIFAGPAGLALTADGQRLYVADQGHHVIRRIDVGTAQVETFVGDIGVRDAFDGVGADATFSLPAHLSLAQNDQVLVVSDRANFAIRHVDIAESAVTTLVGSLGTSGGSGLRYSPLDEARLYFTSGVSVAGNDVILTADEALLRVSDVLGE
ncbi:hypothetical protein EA187_04035 [Lujinxingia sediminis]|uniref:Teneurin NHL domain-containing protein n=1 Tax=Lujinxingia sediminis TaxID=2480984 RepID=A0ABY0CY14_9DELT|nr:hypothetical protein [Lujinxingia sediminis]RVU48609.1 hypothetical protein EA187_04035 [Lujinxingia sediminis]